MPGDNRFNLHWPVTVSIKNLSAAWFILFSANPDHFLSASGQDSSMVDAAPDMKKGQMLKSKVGKRLPQKIVKISAFFYI